MPTLLSLPAGPSPGTTSNKPPLERFLSGLLILFFPEGVLTVFVLTQFVYWEVEGSSRSESPTSSFSSPGPRSSGITTKNETVFYGTLEPVRGREEPLNQCRRVNIFFQPRLSETLGSLV